MSEPKKPIESNEILRNASAPYRIDFEEPYRISVKDLKQHVDKSDTNHKRWNWPKTNLLSLNDGLMTIETKNDLHSFQLTVQVEKGHCTVSCNCGTMVHKLCCHAYGTLESMAKFGTYLKLEDFCRDGLLELARKYPRNFNVIEEDRLEMRVKVPLGFGEVFLPDNTEFNDLLERLSFNRVPVTYYKFKQPLELAIGYAIVYFRGSRVLPFILPYWGKLNKAGTDMKFYESFLLETTELPEISFTDEQRLLNSICFEMYRLTTSLSKRISIEPAHQQNMLSMFHLWERAWALLAGQKYIRLFRCGNLVRLRHKPTKAYMIDYTLSQARPQISFSLQRKGDLNRCHLIMKAAGKDLLEPDKYDINSFFVLQWETSTLYLFASIKDTLLINWLNGRKAMTSFKQYFHLFRDGVLKELSNIYPTRYIDGANKNLYNQTKQLMPIKRLIKLKAYRNWMLFTPMIEYDDGSVISVMTNGKGWLTEEDGKEILVQRDKPYEKQLKDFIQGLHPDFKKQTNSIAFYLPLGSQEELDWFDKAHIIIKEAGIAYRFESTEIEEYGLPEENQPKEPIEPTTNEEAE